MTMNSKIGAYTVTCIYFATSAACPAKLQAKKYRTLVSKTASDAKRFLVAGFCVVQMHRTMHNGTGCSLKAEQPVSGLCIHPQVAAVPCAGLAIHLTPLWPMYGSGNGGATLSRIPVS